MKNSSDAEQERHYTEQIFLFIAERASSHEKMLRKERKHFFMLIQRQTVCKVMEHFPIKHFHLVAHFKERFCEPTRFELANVENERSEGEQRVCQALIAFLAWRIAFCAAFTCESRNGPRSRVHLSRMHTRENK